MLEITTAGGTAAFNSDTDYIQSGFTQRSETTSTPITNSGILWGAAATAMLGATLADWQRKREEEEAKKRAEAAAQEQGGGGGKKTPGQIAYEKMMQQKHIVGESQALLNEKAKEKAEQAEQARQNLIAKNEDKAPVDMAKVNQLVEEESARQALIAKNEDKAPMDMVKVQQLVAAKQEEEKPSGNWLSNLWNAGVSAVGGVLSPKNVGGGGLLSVRDGDPPNPIAEWWDEHVVQPIKNLFDRSQTEPVATSTAVLPTPHAYITHAPTITPSPTTTLTPTLPPLPSATPTIIHFNPTLSDFELKTINMEKKDQEVVISAANLVGLRLVPYIPEARGYPTLAYKIAMGNATIIIDSQAHIDNYGGNCLTTKNSLLPFSWKNIFAPDTYLTVYDQIKDGQIIQTSVNVNTLQTIVCKEPPTEANLIHEFEHLLINTQTLAKNINIYSLVQPIQASNGRMLDMDTNGHWVREETGFIKGTDSWEHYPVNQEEWVNGIAKNEHSADMFLNFVYDGTGNENYGFTDDAMGSARWLEMDKILKTIFGQ